ncbi:MAG: hypothetical protein AYL32_013880 [Candidatus Bathyarchaeota archaeon B26-2]|nr:MAG: hypothetical protein AYL32_013880 [Candidatus Bathyarchaeota archaeon B26-2]
MLIDGFTFGFAEVGGMDSTDSIIEMYRTLRREDVNLLLLNGCVISWYNVVDLQRLYEETGIPLICVTYEESPGLERYFKELFPRDWEYRVAIYRKNGGRTPLKLKTGHTVYARFLGASREEAEGVLNKFTLQGAVPEPLRVARLLARSLMRTLKPEIYRGR